MTAILLESYRRSAENKLLQPFELCVIQSCKLCLGNDYGCDTLDFQLDYKRHKERHEFDDNVYQLNFITHFFHFLWTKHKNYKIVFGLLKLNNTLAQAVAKSPGHKNYEMFEQMVANISNDVYLLITNKQQELLPLGTDTRNLAICAKDEIKRNDLLYNFFSSVINTKNSNSSQLWVEAWVAAHLSVELLILKVSRLLYIFMIHNF